MVGAVGWIGEDKFDLRQDFGAEVEVRGRLEPSNSPPAAQLRSEYIVRAETCCRNQEAGTSPAKSARNSNQSTSLGSPISSDPSRDGCVVTVAAMVARFMRLALSDCELLMPR